MAFGVALGGVIFQNRWDHIVKGAIESGSLSLAYYIPSNHAEVAYDVIKGYPSAVRLLYQSFYAESLLMVWWVMFAFAIVGLVVSLFGRNESLTPSETGLHSFVEDTKHENGPVV